MPAITSCLQYQGCLRLSQHWVQPCSVYNSTASNVLIAPPPAHTQQQLTGPWLTPCNKCKACCAGRKNGQDARWLQQVRRSGTTSDRVAALTLLLQESVVANLRSLDVLLNWVIKRKGGRNVVAQVPSRLCACVYSLKAAAIRGSLLGKLPDTHAHFATFLCFFARGVCAPAAVQGLSWHQCCHGCQQQRYKDL